MFHHQECSPTRGCRDAKQALGRRLCLQSVRGNTPADSPVYGLLTAGLHPCSKNEAMNNEAFVTMDLMDRIQIVRDRAMNEGYIATAKALDNLLKNGVLFELPKGKKDSPNGQTLS